MISSIYGVKVFDKERILLPEKPFLSLPVSLMPTKGLKRKARKFNRNFKEKIDWSYDNKEKYKFE